MEYRFFLYHPDVGNWTRITDPEGWDGIGRTIKRFGIDNAVGQKWHGLFYEYSAKLRFVKNGKNFIIGYFNTYGIEQDILVKVEKRNVSTRKFETEYIGRLDLTSRKFTEIYAEVKIENTGFIQRLKNALDVKVDLSKLVTQGGKAIEANDDELHTIELHSKVLQRTFRQAGIASGIRSAGAGTYYFLVGTGLTGVNPAQAELYIDEIEERFDYPLQLADVDPKTDQKYRFLVKEGGDYSFNYNFTYVITDNLSTSRDWTVQWVLAYGTPGSYTTTNIGTQDTNNGAVSIGGTKQFTADISLTEGDELYLYAVVTMTNATVADISFQISNKSIPAGEYLETITADTQVAASDCNVVLVHEAFSRVVESITDKKLSFYSLHFGRTDSEPQTYASDGAGSLRAITNGKNIRKKSVPIHCSLRDLVDTFAGIDGIGLGIEKVNGVERVRVEPITYWYQAQRLMQLSYVKDIEKEGLNDLVWNQLEVGPTKWEMERINTLDEVNAKREWTLPVTQIKNTLDLKTPYITGGYPIEFTRRMVSEPTKDSRYDDDNFVIDLVRTEGGFAPAKDEAFSSVTGVISPSTAYNLELSPRRCIERNGRLIRAGLDKLHNKSIKFAFGEANTAMSSTLTGGSAVDEDGDILVSTLDAPLFVAEVYTVRAKLTKAQMDALGVSDISAAQNVFQFVEFSKTDRDFKRGYILEARPASNSNEVTLRLLKTQL